MRFVILVVGATASGALSVGAVRTMVPQNAQMFQAVRALGGNLADIKIADINPLKAYEQVKQKITSGDFGAPRDFGASAPVQWPKLGDAALGANFQFDQAAAQRGIAAGIVSRTQQDLRHMEDLRNYGRNPAGWHGAPPF
jgi:hypothetical protein